MIAAGWVHRHQRIVIEFLQAGNRLLNRLRGKRIRFTDVERAGTKSRQWDAIRSSSAIIRSAPPRLVGLVAFSTRKRAATNPLISRCRVNPFKGKMPETGRKYYRPFSLASLAGVAFRGMTGRTVNPVLSVSRRSLNNGR